MLGRAGEGIGLIEAAIERQARGEYHAQLARLFTLVRRDQDAARALAAAEVSLPADALGRASADPGAIGRDYLARAATHLTGAKHRFTDKFPSNFHYLGTIARAVPNAKIVCLRRNPLDTVLANFRNLFAIGSRYYDYSYDLLEIAAYFHRFDRLMTWWSAVLPGRVLELGYEALVADQEGETCRLLEGHGINVD